MVRVRVKGGMGGKRVAKGTCVVKGGVWQKGGMPGWEGACVAGEMATTTGSTHPTGMHSFSTCKSSS